MANRITIGAEDGRGYLTAYPRWGYKELEIARGAPGRTRFVNNRLWFELTVENSAYMATHFGEKPLSDQICNPDDAVRGSRPTFRTKLKSTALQVEALDRARGEPLFAFFEKPGSGKTKILLDHAIKAWCAGLIDGILVVCPNFVHEQWVVDEIPKHVHSSIPITTAFYQPGKKLKPASVLGRDLSRLRIVTVGFESYKAEPFLPLRDTFLASGRIAIIVDESHRIKTPRAAISRRLNADALLFEQRFVASGEPIPLGLQDYYPQIRFLDPRILNIYSFAGFKNTYCRMGGFENRQIVGYQNEAELHRVMAPYVHVGEPSIDAEQLYTTRKHSLLPRARAMYDEMRRNMLVMLDTGEIATATNVLVATLRLQGIALGRLTITPDDGSEPYIKEIPTNRPALLDEILKGIDGKVIIWNEWRPDIAWQQEKFKDALAIHGGVARSERQKIKEAFLDPKSGVDKLLASPGAAGTGLNLHGSCWHNIYYSQRDNAGLRWQSERRTYRLGVDRDVRYWDIIARSTVDVVVNRRNRRKKDRARMSFEEFRAILEGDLDD